MKRRIAVRGIIQKDDGSLFCVRQRHQDGSVNSFWCTPGGGLDDNEALEAGLRRELTEETGVQPDIGKLLYIQQYHDKEYEFLEFFFEVLNPHNFEKIDLAATSHGQVELVEYGFISPKSEDIIPNFLRSVVPEPQVQLFNYLTN